MAEKQLLRQMWKNPFLDDLAKYLYEKETITGDEFMEISNSS
ncbi:MAG: hypothetical protein ACI4JQ_00585 [Ruminococcus sp.]